MPPSRRLSTSPGGRLADGSFAGARLQSASVRAIDAQRNIQRMAGKLNAAMDDVTAPHGIRVTGLSEEDSAVIVVNEALMQLRPKD